MHISPFFPYISQLSHLPKAFWVQFTSFPDKSQNAPSSRSICQGDIQYVGLIIRDWQTISQVMSRYLDSILLFFKIKNVLILPLIRSLWNTIWKSLFLHSLKRLWQMNKLVIFLKFSNLHPILVKFLYLEKQRKELDWARWAPIPLDWSTQRHPVSPLRSLRLGRSAQSTAELRTHRTASGAKAAYSEQIQQIRRTG